MHNRSNSLGRPHLHICDIYQCPKHSRVTWFSPVFLLLNWLGNFLTLMVLGFSNLTGYGIKRPVSSESNYRKTKPLREINPLGHYIPPTIGCHIILCKSRSGCISIAVIISPLTPQLVIILIVFSLK